jgi:hypothetical protein
MVFPGIQTLRIEREHVDAEIVALESEKQAIVQTIPKLLSAISARNEGIEAKFRDIVIYDRALDEIESAYGHILYTSRFFADGAAPHTPF